VKLVRHKATGNYLALKSLKKIEVLRLKQLKHVLSEKRILARTNHPFIICL
jgi:serine/threonine protein kinase